MANDDFIHDPGPSRTTPLTSSFDKPSGMTGEPEGGNAPPPFSLAKGPEAAGKAEGPSPMAVGAEAASPFNPQAISGTSLEQQAQAISSQFDKSRSLLQDPALAQNQNLIKASTTDLLSQHLSKVNENMTSLGAKLGTPVATQYTPPSASTQAVAHFLDYLTGGQQDLVNLSQGLSNKSGKLSPGDLLTVQMKMSGVQQQMEFFSVLLGKAVDNIKTIMNIQS